MGLFDRLKAGLSRTTQQIVRALRRHRPRRRHARAALATRRRRHARRPRGAAHLGRRRRRGHRAHSRRRQARTRNRDREPARARAPRDPRHLRRRATAGRATGSRTSTLIVGVNGTGKTTTVGKLASLAKREGRHPLICAADTFRAAAVDQLQIWADRAGVEIVRTKDGADPAAVVFDAVTSGKAQGFAPILVDTAGRLHTAPEPDAGAREDPPRRRAGRAGRAARSAHRAGRDGGAERARAGAAVHGGRRRDRRRADETRRHREGRRRRGDRRTT